MLAFKPQFCTAVAQCADGDVHGADSGSQAAVGNQALGREHSIRMEMGGTQEVPFL
jgi:hypothetical protein